jgi:O-glycosyl hydrolase
VKSRIANNYPGTELAISEYNYGGGNHISGGIAQADVLGIFGREGLFAANYWDLNGQNNFVYGAFNMFLSYNGSGASVGNKSIAASTTDNEKSSIYAMTRQGDNSTLYVIAINKTANPITTLVQVDHPVALSTAEIYQLTSASSNPQTKPSIQFSENQFTYALPAYSVTTFVLK